MALEKRLKAIPAQLFTADGTTDGLITLVSDACRFKVKQQVFLSGSTLPNLDQIEVKRVISDTQLYVGPKGGNIDSRVNISAYTLALGATITANEQLRPSIPQEELIRAMYEEEPTVAQRSILVDRCGDDYDEDNPLPIAFDGTISIGAVEVKDQDGDILEVNSDGSINVNIVSSSDTPGLVLKYNEISSVPSGVETTMITVMSPPSGHRIEKIEVSGDNIALYRVYINGTPILAKRTWWTSFNETFNFENFPNGLVLTTGQVLTVTCLHSSPYLGTFDTTVMTLTN